MSNRQKTRNAILTVLFLITYVLLGWTIVVPLIATRIVFSSSFNVRISKPDAFIDEKFYKGLNKKEYKFKSRRNTLSGAFFFYEDKKPYKGLVLVCHGIGCCKYNYLNRCEYFAKKGYLTFCFDMTGCDESEGKGMIGLQEGTIDIINAVQFVQTLEETKGLKIFIYGHSWSGYSSAAALNSPKLSNITALATISGFNTFWETMRDQGTRRVGKMFCIAKPFAYLYCDIKFGRAARYNGINGINKFNKPVIVLHSKDDTTVPYRLGIISAKDKCINSKAKFVSFENRGHSISRPVEINNKIDKSIEGKDDMPLDGRNIFQYYVDNRYRFSSLEDVYAIDDKFMDIIEKFFEEAAKEEEA